MIEEHEFVTNAVGVTFLRVKFSWYNKEIFIRQDELNELSELSRSSKELKDEIERQWNRSQDLRKQLAAAHEAADNILYIRGTGMDAGSSSLEYRLTEIAAYVESLKAEIDYLNGWKDDAVNLYPELERMPKYKGKELPSGIVAHVSPDIQPQTLAALDAMGWILRAQMAEKDVESMRETITWLREDNAEMRAMLKRLEWDASGPYEETYCSVCKNRQDDGHTEDCQLARMLEDGGKQ